MKVQQIFADAIHRFWDVLIRPAVTQTNPGSEAGILKALLNGSAQCWVGLEDGENGTEKVVAIGITSITEDRILGVRNLIIYHLHAVEDISAKSWMEGLEKLLLYGKGRKCQNLVAYANNKRMEQLARIAGGDTSYKFIKVEIPK